MMTNIEIPKGYTIRPATLSDTSEVVRLRVAMQQEHRPGIEISDEYLQATQASFEEMLTTDFYRGWLAFADGQDKPIAVAGYLAFHHPPKPERLNQERAYVVSVYTEPEHRYRGVGQAIMHHLIEHARANGFRRLELRPSLEGRRLYTKLGFVPQEVFMLEL
jgi:ribosomal protein S18 acetylase RimI-like enzyme